VSASAEGLTAFTCKEATGTPQYTTSRCEVESETGKFSTVVIPAEETEVTGEATTTSELKGTIALTQVVVACTSAPSTGKVHNALVGTEMQAIGSQTVIDYSGCTAFLASNHAKVCEVEDLVGGLGTHGTILTKPLKSKTSFSGAEHRVTFEPEVAGSEFAKFKILQKTECPAALIGVTVTVTGSVFGVVPVAKHSHIMFSGTGGGLLKANGGTAEYFGTNRGVMKETENAIGLKTA
jgi:hypothetical protein